MTDQIKHAADSAPDANAPSNPGAQPAPRPWVKPTFERIEMKEAMTSAVSGGPNDSAPPLSS